MGVDLLLTFGELVLGLLEHVRPELLRSMQAEATGPVVALRTGPGNVCALREG